MNEPENPPAFPQASPDMCLEGQKVKDTQGMSLRDWFAGHATDADVREYQLNDEGERNNATREQAKYAYADAMLAARQSKQP